MGSLVDKVFLVRFHAFAKNVIRPAFQLAIEQAQEALRCLSIFFYVLSLIVLVEISNAQGSESSTQVVPLVTMK